MNGKDAVRMWAKETIFDLYDAKLDYDFEELEFTGSSAYAWGWFRQELNPKDGSPPLELRGKFLDVFRKNEAGEWKLARCAYSTDTE
jgi:ketosteroid isomerase-like protein